MRSLISILFLIPLLINCQSEKTAVSKYPANVGDLEFDIKQDGDFKKCSENESYQYYNDSKGFQIEGEKNKIIQEVQKLKFKENKNSNGYLTIRFVVNCKGETGIFRMQQMDSEYKAYKFDEALSSQILNFTKNLTGWIPKEIDGIKRDYYQYLTYKIVHGQVSEILP